MTAILAHADDSGRNALPIVPPCPRAALAPRGRVACRVLCAEGPVLYLAAPPSALVELPAARQALSPDLAETEEAEREHGARPGDGERRPAITAAADGGNNNLVPRCPGHRRPSAARFQGRAGFRLTLQVAGSPGRPDPA